MRERILSFITDYIESRGYSPSYREIAKGVGLRSASTVLHHLGSLAAEGSIGFRPNTPRSIHLKSRATGVPSE